MIYYIFLRGHVLGYNYVRPIVNQLSDEYNIKINDKNYIFNWDI